MAEWFDNWFDSPYYHELYFKRDQQEATSFINALIKHLKPADDSRMLDVACGRGRHSLTLSKGPYHVTGIDLSYQSIIAAKEAEQYNLEFFQHDMRLPFRINYYDYAFNFFTSFGYFRTRREHDAALRTIARSLHLNGILVIDYLNTHYSEDHLIHETDVPSGAFNFHITKWMDETHFYKKIEVEHDQFTVPHIFTEKVSKFSLGDFTEMLAFQGMQIQEVFGDYQFGTYHVRNKPRMIMIAKKIKSE